MSTNSVEAFLHKLGNDGPTMEAFLADPETVLDRYTMSAEERRQLIEWDLHAIINSGVSPMALMLAYFNTHGGHDARPEYIRILKEPPARKGN